MPPPRWDRGGRPGCEDRFELDWWFHLARAVPADPVVPVDEPGHFPAGGRLVSKCRLRNSSHSNALAESFFASLQCELLDRHSWPTRAGLARALFTWIEGFYNPTRRHSTLDYLSPVDYETATVT